MSQHVRALPCRLSLLVLSICCCQLAAAAAPSVRAHFVAPGRRGPVLTLEVADSVAARATGLMYRRRLPSRAGMLFVFEEAAPRSFWMKDTYLPLDMIFVDDSCTVVHIIADTPPHSTADQSCPQPVRFVVELAAGSAAKFGIERGQLLDFRLPQPGGVLRCPRSPEAKKPAGPPA